MSNAVTCPACNGKRHKAHSEVIGVYTCQKCGALHGQCYLGDSYRLVKPFFAPVDPPAEQVRYFDFVTLGSAGIDRRHGWYDTASGCVTQIG